MPVQEDLLEKGFQLAYFIFPDRSVAVRILTGALNKLRLQRGRESRRSYWRDKHLKRAITRITREESDALQWLIFYESDHYEKQQEQQTTPAIREMIVRYVKNLVRMTTAMSSFYVNIGLQRLLHNYSTTETQRIYEAVTERYLGADEYRRAKGALMDKLAQRFGAILKTFRTQHGELRFEAKENQAQWAPLVEVCLKAFTPWSTSTACPVPSNFDALQVKLPAKLSGHGEEKIDPNEVEINRCHAFIDPLCYGRLMEALSFAAPAEKLALPRFHMENARHDDTTHQPPRTSGLTAEERKSIIEQLSEQEGRRQRTDPQFLSVVVDGSERARLDLGRPGGRSFQIKEGDELIELRTSAGGEDLLLAIHPVAYTEHQGIATAERTLWRSRGGSLELRITPETAAGTEPHTATVVLSFKPSTLASFLPGYVSASGGWRNLARLTVPVLALLIVVWVAGRFTVPKQPAPQQVAPVIQPQPAPATVAQATNKSDVDLTARLMPADETVRTALLTPYDETTRSEGGADNTVTISHQAALVKLELPVPADYAHATFRASLKHFAEGREIVTMHSLRAKSSQAGWMVTLPVPAQLLEKDGDYMIDLRSVSRGKLEEVNTYVFVVVRIAR